MQEDDKSVAAVAVAMADEPKHPLVLVVESRDASLLKRYLEAFVGQGVVKSDLEILGWGLERAIELDDLLMVRLLLAEDARTKLVVTDSPMALALRLGHRTIVDEMIRTVVIRNAPGFRYKNKTVRHTSDSEVELAAELGDSRALERLFRAGGVDGVDAGDALLIAVSRRDLAAVRVILPHCGKLALSPGERSALSIAMHNGYTEIMDAILDERERRNVNLGWWGWIRCFNC